MRELFRRIAFAICVISVFVLLPVDSATAQGVSANAQCDANKYDGSRNYTEINPSTGQRGLKFKPCASLDTAKPPNVTGRGFCTKPNSCGLMPAEKGQSIEKYVSELPPVAKESFLQAQKDTQSSVVQSLDRLQKADTVYQQALRDGGNISDAFAERSRASDELTNSVVQAQLYSSDKVLEALNALAEYREIELIQVDETPPPIDPAYTERFLKEIVALESGSLLEKSEEGTLTGSLNDELALGSTFEESDLVLAAVNMEGTGTYCYYGALGGEYCFTPKDGGQRACQDARSTWRLETACIEKVQPQAPPSEGPLGKEEVAPRNSDDPAENAMRAELQRKLEDARRQQREYEDCVAAGRWLCRMPWNKNSEDHAQRIRELEETLRNLNKYGPTEEMRRQYERQQNGGESDNFVVRGLRKIGNLISSLAPEHNGSWLDWRWWAGVPVRIIGDGISSLPQAFGYSDPRNALSVAVDADADWWSRFEGNLSVAGVLPIGSAGKYGLQGILTTWRGALSATKETLVNLTIMATPKEWSAAGRYIAGRLSRTTDSVLRGVDGFLSGSTESLRPIARQIDEPVLPGRPAEAAPQPPIAPYVGDVPRPQKIGVIGSDAPVSPGAPYRDARPQTQTAQRASESANPAMPKVTDIEVSTLPDGSLAVQYDLKAQQFVKRVYEASPELNYLAKVDAVGMQRNLTEAELRLIAENMSRLSGGAIKDVKIVERIGIEGLEFNPNNLGRYHEPSRTIYMHPDLLAKPELFIQELTHEAGAIRIADIFGGKTQIPYILENGEKARLSLNHRVDLYVYDQALGVKSRATGDLALPAIETATPRPSVTALETPKPLELSPTVKPPARLESILATAKTMLFVSYTSVKSALSRALDLVWNKYAGTTAITTSGMGGTLIYNMLPPTGSSPSPESLDPVLMPPAIESEVPTAPPTETPIPEKPALPPEKQLPPSTPKETPPQPRASVSPPSMPLERPATPALRGTQNNPEASQSSDLLDLLSYLSNVLSSMLAQFMVQSGSQSVPNQPSAAQTSTTTK